MKNKSTLAKYALTLALTAAAAVGTSAQQIYVTSYGFLSDLQNNKNARVYFEVPVCMKNGDTFHVLFGGTAKSLPKQTETLVKDLVSGLSGNITAEDFSSRRINDLLLDVAKEAAEQRNKLEPDSQSKMLLISVKNEGPDRKVALTPGCAL